MKSWLNWPISGFSPMSEGITNVDDDTKAFCVFMLFGLIRFRLAFFHFLALLFLYSCEAEKLLLMMLLWCCCAAASSRQESWKDITYLKELRSWFAFFPIFWKFNFVVASVMGGVSTFLFMFCSVRLQEINKFKDGYKGKDRFVIPRIRILCNLSVL